MRIVRAVLFAFLVGLLAVSAAAAQTHKAVLTWSAPSDAVASSTYNAYRASGACPASGLGTLTFSKINTAAISGLTYSDPGLSVGVYCYYVTQVQSSIESVPSNTAGGIAAPNTISIFTVVVT